MYSELLIRIINQLASKPHINRLLLIFLVADVTVTVTVTADCNRTYVPAQKYNQPKRSSACHFLQCSYRYIVTDIPFIEFSSSYVCINYMLQNNLQV